ncbi:hypothetical protein EC957_008253 [Mortierella hygrophila]|uniref:F-box domain-containing protein n=1 Tax=Mortierella hygrophila TaxID=979708 RepID=A0A9P6K595_9FUNG|nr:hypothetical protein EC957_008253 [Mortierella hygrophila]
MAPSNKVFDIFELTQLIADNLSQKDLALCCLINKSFLNTFAPHLWHSITIHRNDSTPKFQTPEGRAGLLRNGHHIRVLRAYDPVALEPFVESGITCTNLVFLDATHNVGRFTGGLATTRALTVLSKGMKRGSFGVGQRQSFHTVVSSGSGLFGASASVTAGSLNPSKRVYSQAEFQSDGESYLVSILERNSQLEFLVVPSHCLDCQSIVKVAGESLLLLKEFYSDNDLRQRGPATYFSLRKQSRITRPQTGNALEAMEGYLRYTNGGLLHPLLNDYPRLREMQMGISERVNHDALEGIRLADRGFMYLNMSHGQPSHVTQILMRAPPLKYIMLTRYGDAHVSYSSDDNAVKDAFLRHAPTLEHLSTANCDFSKDILQAILCSSPNLRILETIEDDDGSRPNKEVELDALRIIDSFWTCSQVEVFECKILNVPRPDIVITPLGDLFLVPPIPIPPSGPATAQDQVPLSGAMLVAQQGSHAVQRRVLRQLGQLTHLRKLRLGKLCCDLGRPEYSQLEIRGIRTMAVDAYFDTNCLELSLESGLDELAGLNQLEELDIAQMAHRIGLVEVQWMVENWPRLKIINGLRYWDCNVEVYGYAAGVAGSLEESKLEHVKWIRENRPDIQQS